MKKIANKLIKHPLFSGSALMVGGSMVVNVVNYVYHLLMGRVLGPNDYGTLASLFSILYVTSVVPVSASVAIVKFIAGAKDSKERSVIYKSIKKILIYVAIVASVVIALFSPAIAEFLHIKENFSVFLVGPVVFFSLITLVNQSSLQGVLKFSGVVGPNLLASVVKLVLGLLFVYLGWSVTGAIGAVLVGAIIAYMLSAKMIGGFVTHEIDIKFDLKPFMKYSFPVLLQAFAFTSIFTTDVILVKHFFPAFEAGLYAALSTLGKIIYFAASPITATMFPIIAKRNASGGKYEKILLASLSSTLVITVGIVFLYFLFPDLAIGTLYGEKYLLAKDGLVWMGAFIAFYTVSYLLVNFFLSIGRTKVVLLPFVLSILQIVLIWLYHDSLLTVIKISLVLMVILTVSLLGYMGYNQFNKVYVKAKTK